MKPYLLRLHRWMTLVFAAPWIVILLTGLVLSFEPMLMDRLFTGRSVSMSTVEAAIAKHDPAGKANTLNIRAYDNAMILSEGRGAPSTRVNLTTGDLIAPGTWAWSDFFSTNRRLHETLLLDLKWLVDASTIAMLLSLLLGIFMGLPFLRNTLGGWHRMTAWVTLTAAHSLAADRSRHRLRHHLHRPAAQGRRPAGQTRRGREDCGREI